MVSGTWWRVWMQLIARASSSLSFSSAISSVSNCGFCIKVNSKGTPMSRANRSSLVMICLITSIADSCLEITMIVSRRCGVPSALVASASNSIGHCVQKVTLMSTMCIFISPSKASIIAPLPATCPNVVHGLASCTPPVHRWSAWSARILVRRTDNILETKSTS